jgi:hypothetical protein
MNRSKEIRRNLFGKVSSSSQQSAAESSTTIGMVPLNTSKGLTADRDGYLAAAVLYE